MLLSFGVCSHRETKNLEVIGRGLLVKLQDCFIWWEAKKVHVQYQKILTVSTVLLNQKELVLLNAWRVKQEHLVCASIVFDKPWGNQHLFLLSWKYRRLLEALAFGNECISEEFMDDPDLIFIEMNGNSLWDFKSARVYFTFTSLILNLKNSVFFFPPLINNWRLKVTHPNRNHYQYKEEKKKKSAVVTSEVQWCFNNTE